MSCRYQRKRDLCHGMSDPGEARAASSDLPAILQAGGGTELPTQQLEQAAGAAPLPALRPARAAHTLTGL